ncbi:HD domain containing protein [Novymonas esmeraldas]|uniref:HD domain containing protein n=1 Tax=Novymonas esmeraldas TaxID=1808958 RepID=A0AAW0FC75_9TRYP
MPLELHHKAPSVQREEQTDLVEPMRPMSVLDTLYGQIEFPPVIRILTDSPVVQRLRDLKQLGSSYYVYPGATHSRFEHSLGVCYLGMELYGSIVDSHREERRDFGVPQIAALSREAARKDMHCVGIAGLCHDLGHGPLSHLFEPFVRSSALSTETALRNWSHEQASIMMLRKLWTEKEAELAGLGFTEVDLRFVELLIEGLAPGKQWPTNVGRAEWARFTTEIVANKRSGLDVDKIDYIQRDSVACLGATTFVSMRRLFQGARVVLSEAGETSIGYPDKLDGIIEEIFLARSHLHHIVYQHRVTKIIDLMTLDSLRAAGDALVVSDGHGGTKPLRACVLDPDTYVHASDWIIQAILHNGDPKVAKARGILQRIQCRQLYTSIGTYRHKESRLSTDKPPHSFESSSQKEKRDSVLHRLEAELTTADVKLRVKLAEWSKENNASDAMEVLQAEITQTAGDMDKRRNPVMNTLFFNPRQSTHARIVPHTSRNVTTTLYVKHAPVSSLVVVCRAPLIWSEKQVLRDCFNYAADDLGVKHGANFSATPVSHRGRGDSSSPLRYSQPLPRASAQPSRTGVADADVCGSPPTAMETSSNSSGADGGADDDVPAAKRCKPDVVVSESERPAFSIGNRSDGAGRRGTALRSPGPMTPRDEGDEHEDQEELEILPPT